MVISICNQKGGVGKTTTAINISASLALRNAGSVLLVDFDPQANATSGIGIERSELTSSVYDFINSNIGKEVVRNTAVANLSVMPSAIELCGSEIELIESSDREFRLKHKIAQELQGYSYIIIDTPPSLGILTLNSLVASDKVIVPIQCEYFALEGLMAFLNTVRLIRERLNASLDILGVLLTMADYRTKIACEVEQEIRQNFKDLVFHTVIHRNVRLAEAPSYGKPIGLYDSKSIGTQCYNALTEEILGRLGGYDYGEKERFRPGDIGTHSG